MEVRYLCEEDYDNTLVKWWESWGWIPPNRDMLPQNGTGGVIISKDGVDICAGFIYFTNSTMAWLEYIVSNKEYRNEDRSEAIEMLINVLSSIAKDNGFKYIYASIKSQPLISKYKAAGFKMGDSNCQEMVKIWQQ